MKPVEEEVVQPIETVVPSDPAGIPAEAVAAAAQAMESMEENNRANAIYATTQQPGDTVDTVDSVGIDGEHTAQLLDRADLGASKPVPQPKPNYTVQHPIVTACGHKLNLRQFPRHSNCADCWEAFLEYNPKGVASVHDLLLTGGIKAVTAMHGKGFAKQFGLYLRKKLLTMHASEEIKAASGIEGNELEVFDIAKEAQSGIR